VTRLKTSTIVVLVGAAVVLAALARFSGARADEDEEGKPITSTTAQLSRDKAGHVFIAIQPAAQKEIGIASEVLQPTARTIGSEAYGFILDPAPLATLCSELATTQASLAAAEAQYRRTSVLYGEQKNASLRDLQTAQAAYVADKSHLEALRQQLRNDWGEEFAQLTPQARSRLVSALIDHREAIARVTLPTGEPMADVPRTAKIAVLGHENQPLNAIALYTAPMVVQTLQGQPFLALIAANDFPLRPGAAVSARIPTSNALEQGVLVPRSAVVRYEGREWVYRAIDGNRFVRRAIAPAETTAQGYFVTKNLEPGTRIVVAGAQALLSEELKSEIQPSD
jgi:hypothetical protein